MLRSLVPWSLPLLSLLGALSLAAEPPASLSRVGIPAELERLMSELDFEVKGLEQTEGAFGHVGHGTLVSRLHLLLEDFDHIIVQDASGGIERVIILGEKSDYVPPPLVVQEQGEGDAEEGSVAEDGDIVLPTQRKGASHVVTLGLEGPSKKRLNESMLIDTGADRIVLPLSLMSSLGMDPGELREQQVQTANGSVQARVGKLDAIWLGRQRVQDVEVAFIDDQKLGGISLLGMSLLGRFRMTIDDEQSQLTLATK